MPESRFERRLERVRQMNTQFGKRYDTKAVRAYAGMYDDAVKLMKSDDLKALDLAQEMAPPKCYRRIPCKRRLTTWCGERP